MHKKYDKKDHTMWRAMIFIISLKAFESLYDYNFFFVGYVFSEENWHASRMDEMKNTESSADPQKIIHMERNYFSLLLKYTHFANSHVENCFSTFFQI